LGEQFPISSQCLENILYSMPVPAHLKCAKSQAYVLMNQPFVHTVGAESEQAIIGRTAQDIKRVSDEKNTDAFTQAIVKMEAKLLAEEATQIEKNRVFFTSSGCIKILTITKVPVPDRSGKLKYIFTYGQDETPHYQLIDLWHVYCLNFCNNYALVKAFLSHIGLEKYFMWSIRNNAPSKMQVKSILLCAFSRNNQEAAQQLGITYKTLQTHLSRLSNKMYFGTIQNLIKDIRHYQ